MKKCFIMLVFFIVMLLIAALTDKTSAMISDNDVVEYAGVDIP